MRSLLGANLQLSGRLEEASEELSLALAAQRDSGQDPAGLDETLVALGRVRLDRGEPGDARALFEEALRLREESRLPAEHWRIAEIEIELAAVDRASGEPASPSALSSLRRLEATLPAENYRLKRASRALEASRAGGDVAPSWPR